jgi:hypothetical protein
MAAFPLVSALTGRRKTLVAELHRQLEVMIGSALTTGQDFYAFETGLLPQLWRLGRLFLELFCVSREQASRNTLPPGRQSWVSRAVLTLFGEFSFKRIYVWTPDDGGFCPLDRALGLTEDKCSRALMEQGVRLCTEMSFEHAREVLLRFVPKPPATKVLKEAVLGLGVFTQAFLDQMPAPANDGEVMVLLFDSKGAPMATDGELNQRRGPRAKRPEAASPRHRNRQAREARPPKKRKEVGDKSKNAKMSTLAMAYTLRREGDLLLGPFNVRTYSSFGPKELAFQWARAEATKRGFGPDTTQTMQIVTDGDPDLATYAHKYFPKAIHTLDVYHALEYVWKAALCLHRKDKKARDKWYEEARAKVFDGRVQVLLDELKEERAKVSRTGPGTKSKREGLDGALKYLQPRVCMMNYAELAEQDLEWSSAAVEGKVNKLVGVRFDQGGMRWIQERAQSLLQLRCIDQNGDWATFMNWAMGKVGERADAAGGRRLQRKQPVALPTLKKAA